VAKDELTYAELPTETLFVFEDEATVREDGLVLSDRFHMKKNGTFTSVCGRRIDCSQKDVSKILHKKVIPVDFGIRDHKQTS